jgi:hypothetical protein
MRLGTIVEKRGRLIALSALVLRGKALGFLTDLVFDPASRMIVRPRNGANRSQATYCGNHGTPIVKGQSGQSP